MNVTVVIPAYNEERAIFACMDALCKQKTAHNYKIIVVNNASTDNTASVALSWKDKLALEIMEEPLKGRGAARRAGFAKANTDIILSTDADSKVPPNWIEAMVDTLLSNPKAVACTSPSFITDGSKMTNLTMSIGMPLSLRMYRLIVGHYMVTGGTFAVRRLAYESAGGFDETQDMLDDVDLSFRLAKLGKIIYLPFLRVETEGDIFSKGYIQGFWHYFKHWPKLYKKYRLAKP